MSLYIVDKRKHLKLRVLVDRMGRWLTFIENIYMS